MVKHLQILPSSKGQLEKRSLVKLSSLIEKLTNQMVYSVVPQEHGLLMLIYVLDYYSYLVIGGMLQELFIETHLQVLMPRQAIKLSLVSLRNLVTKPLEESQEGSKLNFIIFSHGSICLRSHFNSRSCHSIFCSRFQRPT